MNLIIGQAFIGFIPYNKEYRLHYNKKLILEPWSYLGYYTVPLLTKQYPETAEITNANELVKFSNPIELLERVFA